MGKGMNVRAPEPKPEPEEPEPVPKSEPKPKPKAKTRTYVTFAEKPGLRLIRSFEWEAAGVPDHEDTLWGPSNDWLIPKDELGLTEEQYRQIITADRNLVEVELPADEE